MASVLEAGTRVINTRNINLSSGRAELLRFLRPQFPPTKVINIVEHDSDTCFASFLTPLAVVVTNVISVTNSISEPKYVAATPICRLTLVINGVESCFVLSHNPLVVSVASTRIDSLYTWYEVINYLKHHQSLMEHPGLTSPEGQVPFGGFQ